MKKGWSIKNIRSNKILDETKIKNKKIKEDLKKKRMDGKVAEIATKKKEEKKREKDLLLF
jgi:hypothetical protein